MCGQDLIEIKERVDRTYRAGEDLTESRRTLREKTKGCGRFLGLYIGELGGRVWQKGKNTNKG